MEVMGEDEVVKLLSPAPNRVFYPKNFPGKSLPKDLKADSYNALGYFERCMILGCWLFKHKHPNMLLDPTNWSSTKHYFVQPAVSGSAPLGLDHTWMNLFNKVKQVDEVDEVVA